MTVMTQAAYARHRGISRQAVYKAARAGRIALTPEGNVDVEAADRAWDQNTDQSAPSNSVTGNPRGAAARRGSEPPPPSLPGTPGGAAAGASNTLSYAQSRAVREAYMARLARLEYEEKSGLLIRADAVRVEVFNAVRKARDLLLTLPDRVAPQVAPSQDEIHSVHTIITGEIDRVLAELSRGVSGGSGRSGGMRGLGSPATADR